MPSPSTQAATSDRILSIDVLRGLTIVGMILINYQSGPEVFAPLRHVGARSVVAVDSRRAVGGILYSARSLQRLCPQR